VLLLFPQAYGAFDSFRGWTLTGMGVSRESSVSLHCRDLALLTVFAFERLKL
jgi:hypothetical protein